MQFKNKLIVPELEPGKFIERSNGVVKGYSVSTYKGLVRDYNEDRVAIIMNITKPTHLGKWPKCSYFAIFDGHGGNKCSDFLKENMHKFVTENIYFPQKPIEALKAGFKRAEDQFTALAIGRDPIEKSGSCAIVALMIDNMCYVANVGDSRAILSLHAGQQTCSISRDHKPSNEEQKQRIEEGGGKVYQSTSKNQSGQPVLGPVRLEPGKLSVSRAFGDIEAKLEKYNGNPNVLIAKPQITYFEVNPEKHDFVMLCSDGIFDRLSNKEATECFWELSTKKDYSFVGGVPAKVMTRAMQKLSTDNLTVLVIVFESETKDEQKMKENVRTNQNKVGHHMRTESKDKYKKIQKETEPIKKIRPISIVGNELFRQKRSSVYNSTKQLVINRSTAQLHEGKLRGKEEGNEMHGKLRG